MYSPLDGMLVHHQITSSIKITPIHLDTWAEVGTVRVECHAQEHNMLSLARAQTRVTQNRGKHINQEASVPPLF